MDEMLHETDVEGDDQINCEEPVMFEMVESDFTEGLSEMVAGE